uniref:Charged multivesicular body protein 4b n=1 Tax=Oryza punctata TaxID=4537 RepID=A0A0E0MBV3_ORYPU
MAPAPPPTTAAGLPYACSTSTDAVVWKSFDASRSPIGPSSGDSVQSAIPAVRADPPGTFPTTKRSSKCYKKMLKKLLSKPKSKKKKEAASSALPTLDRLHETLEMLEKKECFLQKKASAEVERAKDYTKAKNKSAAIQCLKKKKLYETQIEQLANFQLRVHDQIIMLESAKATTDTVDALRSGSSAVKAIHQSVSIDDIENAIEEANEHTENMRQIQEALTTPLGASAHFDEDELEAELEDLEEEELENELPEPPQRTSMEPSARVTTSSQPANDLAELTKLQAEMAL